MVGAVGVSVFGLAKEELMLVLIGIYGFYICYQQNRQMKMIEAQGGGLHDLYSTGSDGGTGGYGSEGGGVTEWGGEYDPGFYGSRNEGDGGGEDEGVGGTEDEGEGGGEGEVEGEG